MKKITSRKFVFTVSISILLAIFLGIFCFNFFGEHASFKASLLSACIFTLPLACISLPCGIGMMVSCDATLAYEDKDTESEDRKIYENGICPFYSHKMD